MPVERIFSYLVHPSRSAEDSLTIKGAAVPKIGKLFALIDGVYATSHAECDTEVAFRCREDGTQENPCRSLFLSYLGTQTLVRGRAIASRLASFSDKRSGLGLLFLISGTDDTGKHRLVVSRFPTDSAILADESENALTVSFLERVFLKNRNSYKAVIYEGRTTSSGFWTGYAVDRQLNLQHTDYSNYWISGFLDSELAVTPALGTQRFATAIRSAAKNAASAEVKREIVAAAVLAPNLRGQRTSISEFGRRFSLSPAVTDAIRKELRRPEMADEHFHFDEGQFNSVVAFKSIELDNGGIMTAPSSSFDDVFHQDPIDGSAGEIKFSTHGKIVDERLKKVPWAR